MKALLVACSLLAVGLVMPTSSAEAGWRTPRAFQRQVQRDVRQFDRRIQRNVRQFNNRRYYRPVTVRSRNSGIRIRF